MFLPARSVNCVVNSFHRRTNSKYLVHPVNTLKRNLSDESNGSYNVSTPIFYVNAEPHIGHLHSLLVADSLHRFHKLLGAKNTRFSTGTDEHGLKIQKAAQLNEIPPKLFCDNVSKKFQELSSAFDIDCTDFVRTSEERHLKAVNHFWRTLIDKQFIYKSNYEGWYCTSDETFVPTSQIEEVERNGTKVKVSSESGNPVEWVSEENYMFKLSELTEKLSRWLNENPRAIEPSKFHDLVKHYLSQGLPDLSVSRPRSRLSWGIAVPGDETQTIYVWLDALVNYLTVTGYPNPSHDWPFDCHVVGKDIIKFHAIYWPAFLMAADLPLPKKIICHSHWTVDDLKMSKSRGNVVNPFDMRTQYGDEALRYYLLREGVPHMDGGFTQLQLTRFANGELADTFGNLLSRCVGKNINRAQEFPATPPESYFSNDEIQELVTNLKALPEECGNHYSSAYFYKGIEAIMKCLRLANQFVQNEKPWVLAKSPENQGRLQNCIYTALETCRICAILLQPIVPRACSVVLDKLSIPESERLWKNAVDQFKPRSALPLSGTSAVVFKKISEPKSDDSRAHA
ncbi:Methionine--tRNA ligase, mitochondrial [Halotydeus destructor]|nr:Methionine--tRNA ligase, mitochondrial [Halotydeus destructor]